MGVIVGILVAIGILRLAWYLLTSAYDTFTDTEAMAFLARLVVVVLVVIGVAAMFRARKR